MSSLIDPTKPVSASATTQSVRDNFQAAKTEIEALQALALTKADIASPTFTGTATVAALTATGLITATGGQIAFPAVQVPSAGANVLDDYEEGSWTPSVGGTATYSAVDGTFVKIGRQVTVMCRMTINAIGTGSASTISGLPFTSAGIGMFLGAAWIDSAAISVAYIVARMSGSATVVIHGLTVAGTTMAALNAIGSGTTIRFTLTYFVD